MSSEIDPRAWPWRCALVLALLGAVACADVRRGEYWEDPQAPGSGDEPEPEPETGGGPDEDTGSPETSTGSDGGSGESSSGGEPALSFETDVLPLLQSGCERCHSEQGQASDTDFILVGDPEADLSTTLDFVDLEAPASSRLLLKGAGQGHTGGTIYDDDSTAYQTILQWIEQGAQP